MRGTQMARQWKIIRLMETRKRGISGNDLAIELDVPAAIAALPGIVETLGPNVPVFLDGGVRRGVHVFKALALGAQAVAVGRPTLYSLALGGAPGVKSMFEALKTELQLTMKLAGCAKISDISRTYVT